MSVILRIIADMEDRVRYEMEREGISEKEASRIPKKDDEERRKWSQTLYGIDPQDPSLYDLVIRTRKTTVGNAVDIICHTVGLKGFQTTPASKTAMEDLTLAAEIKAAFWESGHYIDVSSQCGMVYVKTEAPVAQERALYRDLERISKKIPGIVDFKVNILPRTPYSD